MNDADKTAKRAKAEVQAGDRRKQRLAEALRQNLRLRKARAKAGSTAQPGFSDDSSSEENDTD